MARGEHKVDVFLTNNNFLNRIDTRVAVYPVVRRQEALPGSLSAHNLAN
jgi:hypothetical protein